MRWSENIIEFIWCRLYECVIGKNNVCTWVGEVNEIYSAFILVAYNEELKEVIAQNRLDLLFNRCDLLDKDLWSEKFINIKFY